MKKAIKNKLNGVHWPRLEQIISDTILTMVVSGVLSFLIFIWTRGIEEAVAWIANWF